MDKIRLNNDILNYNEDELRIILCADCNKTLNVTPELYLLSEYNKNDEYICGKCGIKEVENFIEKHYKIESKPKNHRLNCQCLKCR